MVIRNYNSKVLYCRNRNSKLFKRASGDKIDLVKDQKEEENSSSKTDPTYDDLTEASLSLKDDENHGGSVLSKSEEWDNNSDTPDITIEINDTTTMDESSVTEAEDENIANATIADFLEETETIANESRCEDPDEEVFSNLITKATGQTWENIDLGDSNLPPPLLLQENLR